MTVHYIIQCEACAVRMVVREELRNNRFCPSCYTLVDEPDDDDHIPPGSVQG